MDGVDSYVLLLLDFKIIVYVRLLNMLEPGLGIIHSQDPLVESFVLKAFFGLVIGILAIFAHAKIIMSCPGFMLQRHQLVQSFF
jgi:hypothetical protein